MGSLQQGNFSTVWVALKQSAELLRNQHREEAETNIRAIAGQIRFLSSSAENREKESQALQQRIAADVAGIIQREGEIRDSALALQKEIDALNVEISKDQADIEALHGQVNSLLGQIGKAESELHYHQAKLRELNDDSAGSIIRSIFCLGLDRAVMGIAALVDNDAGRIRSLNEELSRFKEAMQHDQDVLRNAEQLLRQLAAKKESSLALLEGLQHREAELHAQEKICRQKLAYFTDVALFYGRLLIMAQQVEHRIEDVRDIVQQLDDEKPTIIDFDSSGADLISLRRSLERFDELLARSPELETA
jgi:chromosome segregation ATPase